MSNLGTVEYPLQLRAQTILCYTAGPRHLRRVTRHIIRRITRPDLNLPNIILSNNNRLCESIDLGA